MGSSTICGSCRVTLPDVEAEPKIPCPNCGSTARNYEMTISETVRARDGYRWKAKHAGATGEHKSYWEAKRHWSLFRDTGEWHEVSQSLDREADRYDKVVTDEHGKVVHECHEPLSAHRSRGDAKRKDD